MKMQNLNKLEHAVIKADAQYFLNRGFIDKNTYHRVLGWLKNKNDREIQLMVADWLKSDTDYEPMIETASAKHFWFIAPFVILGLRLIKRMLNKTSNKLRR